jgi:hypothetical protein
LHGLLLSAVVEPGARPGADDGEEDGPVSGREFPAYVREAYVELARCFLSDGGQRERMGH